jgi:hypothetical protein
MAVEPINSASNRSVLNAAPVPGTTYPLVARWTIFEESSIDSARPAQATIGQSPREDAYFTGALTATSVRSKIISQNFRTTLNNGLFWNLYGSAGEKEVFITARLACALASLVNQYVCHVIPAEVGRITHAPEMGKPLDAPRA